MLCDYCGADTLTTYRVDEGGADVWLCVNCRNDVAYCASVGRIPQDPEDA
jgi:ribosomal protein L37AE/L43A